MRRPRRRYFSETGDGGAGSARPAVCTLCAAGHDSRECPNRYCRSCGETGHTTCKVENRGWQRNTEWRVLSNYQLPSSPPDLKRYQAACVDCGSTVHLRCVPTEAAHEAPRNCVRCMRAGHTVAQCHRGGYVPTLINWLRSKPPNKTAKEAAMALARTAGPGEPRSPTVSEPPGSQPASGAERQEQGASGPARKRKRSRGGEPAKRPREDGAGAAAAAAPPPAAAGARAPANEPANGQHRRGRRLKGRLRRPGVTRSAQLADIEHRRDPNGPRTRHNPQEGGGGGVPASVAQDPSAHPRHRRKKRKGGAPPPAAAPPAAPPASAGLAKPHRLNKRMKRRQKQSGLS